MNDDTTDKSKKIGDTTAPNGPSIPMPAASGKAVVHTATSSAYLSAELLRPELAPQIWAYQDALKVADKADVFALSTGKVMPQQVGVKTDLKPEVTKTYAEFEYSERQAKGKRTHDVLMLVFGAVIGVLATLLLAYLTGGSG